MHDEDKTLFEIFMNNDFGDDGAFFFHIRCWAHTLQLLFGDCQKMNEHIATAFAAAQRLVPLLLKKQTALTLKTLQKNRGLIPRILHTPAVTRWNSFLKSMYQIVQLEEFVNTALPKGDADCVAVRPAEMYAMKVCLAVVQSDTCSVLEAKKAVQMARLSLSCLNLFCFILVLFTLVSNKAN